MCVWGGGGGGASRMHENYDLKWSQTWPLLFFIEGNRRKTLFFLIYSFCLFFSSRSLKKDKKRIRNKKENRKEENRKKREQKKNTFSHFQQVSFFGIFSAPLFCVYDNRTRLVSYFRLCEAAIFSVCF